MTHDPLCPVVNGCVVCEEPDDYLCCQCELIQRVRLDTLNNKYHDDQIEWEQAYKAGHEDAILECNMTFEDFKKRNKEWKEIMKAMNIKDSR